MVRFAVARRGWLSAMLLLKPLHLAALLILLFTVSVSARADVVLLLEEPINRIGRLTASGHASLLLDNLCSDDHIHMRLCRQGETGSVISRYNGIANYDWLAMAPTPYLFASNDPKSIPATMTLHDLEQMREAYRTENLADLVPAPQDEKWIQLVGASYRRRIIAIRMHTSPEADLRLMHWLNDRKNVSHFNLLYSNCADFTAMMLNVLYPGAVHRSYMFDLGIMTPKQLFSALHRYAERHPELGWEVVLLPQVPGDVPRSRNKMYGVTEAFVKTKPYLLPLAIVEPIEIGSVTFSWLCDRRYSYHKALEDAPSLSSSDMATGGELTGSGSASQTKTVAGSGGN